MPTQCIDAKSLVKDDAERPRMSVVFRAFLLEEYSPCFCWDPVL